MRKFGITGSLASGKTSALKILGDLTDKKLIYSADETVKDIYNDKYYQNKISKKLKISRVKNLKKFVKKLLIENKLKLSKLEKIIHPITRIKMNQFLKNNNKNKYVFLEIPLLIEKKMMRLFDVIIFVDAPRKLRLKRYLKKGGTINLFNNLENRQLSSKKKRRISNYTVVNKFSKTLLKKKLRIIIKKYE